MQRKILYLIIFGIALAMMAGGSSNALADDFYKGKTIRFVVGYAPGGGYDTYTRATVRHMGKHIPGNPTPVVQNMTGGGSLIAANYIYNRARPDGLTMGIWNSGIILQQVLGEKKVKFTADKFGWVGAPVKGWPTCAIMGHTGLKTLKDVMNSNQRIKVGATRAGSTTDDLPKILNQTLGTRFDVISGYTGTATIRIAMQKQEVDAACWGWESMGVTARAMLDASGEGQLIPFLIHGSLDNPEPEVKGLPQILDVIKGEGNVATFKAWASTYDFQRPLSLPPGTPKGRLKILRKAYRDTMKDPAFLKDAKKSKLIISYVSGQDIEKHVATILGTPASAKEKLGFLVRKKKRN